MSQGQETKCYLIQSQRGWGFFSLRSAGIISLEIPILTRAEAITKACDRGTLSPLAESSEAKRIATLIDKYFRGYKVSFDEVRIDLSERTPFQQRAYRELMTVKYGVTITYGMLAEKMKAKGAARAIGQAMSKNRIPIIVPCHRVLSSGNKLTGFSATGGIPTKKWLLAHEVAYTESPLYC